LQIDIPSYFETRLNIPILSDLILPGMADDRLSQKIRLDLDGSMISIILNRSRQKDLKPGKPHH
jgi:hypothetical protein